MTPGRDKHHVLEALLIAGGYSVTEDWLSGRHFVLKKVTEPRFCSEITLGGVVRELVSPRNVRHFLRRGWRVETFNGLIPTIKVWRGVEVTDVRSEDLYEFIKAGWLSVSTVPMWHITPTREMGRVNRYERFQIDGLPQGETPWVDGYGGHNPECLFKAEEPESEPWHRYEHFEEEFA
ncbi:hypothetical protein [Aromatoleum aromaticum]|uniref:hypothetical protein n=1 Tax=Aromatoleum aromaticum TaxID=551760 RepID=UPI0005A0EB49|nr:hypothetical protein [Aromatoleum aromaticum]